MARRPSEYIELSGPLFDPATIAKFEDALGGGIEELGELGAEILQGTIAAANFIDSGEFISSVTSIYKQERGAGFALVKPTAVWPEPGRPTRTWFERGTRRNVKLRKGGGGFAKTRTRLRTVGLGPVFEDRIERALN